LGRRTSADVYNIPVNGEKIYLRLWFVTLRGLRFKDYSYDTTITIPDRPAELINPLPPELLMSKVSLFLSWYRYFHHCSLCPHRRLISVRASLVQDQR
jgi:hypothetical protein